MNLQQFLATLKYDLFLAVLPLAGQTATAIAADPTPLNASLQFSKFQVDALAALPTLEGTLAKDLAAMVNTEIQNAIASAAKAAGK